MSKSRLDAAGKPLTTEHCPTCCHKLDAATIGPGQGDVRPKPGDVSVCAYCGEILEFAQDMRLAIASVATLMKLQDDRDAWRVLSKAQKLIRRDRPGQDSAPGASAA